MKICDRCGGKEAVKTLNLVTSVDMKTEKIDVCDKCTESMLNLIKWFFLSEKMTVNVLLKTKVVMNENM